MGRLPVEVSAPREYSFVKNMLTANRSFEVGLKSMRPLYWFPSVVLGAAACTNSRSGIPSRPPPTAGSTYAPDTPVNEPTSMPPATCWHWPAANAAGHGELRTFTTRGAMPGDEKICAVTLFGRALINDWRNCGVSTHVVYVALERLRSPS